MRVTDVRIQNFKSIVDTGWVPIQDDITTLLGRNEGGKTSFLEGIYYFDEDREIHDHEIHDELDTSEDEKLAITELRLEITEQSADKLTTGEEAIEAGDEIIARKYSNGTREFFTPHGRKLDQVFDPVGVAQRTAEDAWQNLNNLRNQFSGSFRNHFDNTIKQHLNNLRNNDDLNKDQAKNWSGNALKGIRDIPEQNEDIVEAKENWRNEFDQLVNRLNQDRDEIGDLLPSIVYHGGFDTISDDVQIQSIDSPEHRTFRNLLEIVDLTPDEFESLDYHDQNQAIKRAEGSIRGQVNELWEQKEVDVDISYRDNRFMVGIEDTALSHIQAGGDGDNRKVSRSLKRPSDRSKGFQWFFSFYINLRAETSGVETENQIILLDDPAVFLHPEGKKNWLDAIEEMAESAQFVYSSHSPFLIRKEYPNRIRVVEDRDNDGTIVTEDFNSSDSMTLEPLRNALGIGLGDSPFVSKRKVLVEGVSDYEILIGLANYFRDYQSEDILSWEEVTIMPTNGGNNMVRAAKWVASEEFSYVLLLDNDQKGKDVVQEIEKQHQEIDPDRVIMLEKDDGRRNFNIEIEDLFRTEFYIDCVNKAYASQFEEFQPIELEETEEGWIIGGHEYKGRKIVNRIEEVFDQRERGDLDKILVANEIQERLNRNRDVSAEDVEAFKPILGKIRNLT